MTDVERGLCEYAEKLTLTPVTMGEDDIIGLRTLGLDDETIHHAVQVISYFNYINRIADAVRVDLEVEMKPYPQA